jgi:hypothetical protein
MVYGMSFNLSINENQSWNPLDMYKQKEKLMERQDNKFSLPELPKLPRIEFEEPQSGVKEKRNKKHRQKLWSSRSHDKIISKQITFNASKQKHRELWDLMTLVDSDRLEHRMQDSGIRKIWGETKHADPLKWHLDLPGNFNKTHVALQPLLIKSIVKVLQGIPSALFSLTQIAPEVSIHS